MVIRNFIIVSTFLGLFSSNAFFLLGSVHYLYFYPLITLNLVFLWLSSSLWLPKSLILFLGCLLLSGAAGFVQSTDSIGLFLKTFVGILLNSIYFCAFVRYMRFDVPRCFSLYANLAFYVALLGIFLLPFQMSLGRSDRLLSIMAEPGEFAIVCVPALFYYADRWQRGLRGGCESGVLLLALILAGSSMGFLGMLFGLYLFGTRYRSGALLTPAVVLLVGFVLYNGSSDFRLRFDDTLIGLVSADASGINLSSFSFVSSVFVTEQVLAHHPLIGAGLGSHPLSNDRYIGGLPGVQGFFDAGLSTISSGDAGSLLLRLLSETGVAGVCLALWFLWSCFPRGDSPERKGIAMAILTYVFVKLVRSGIYFNPEEFFFFVLYAVNGSPRFRRARSTASAQWSLPSTLPALAFSQGIASASN